MYEPKPIRTSHIDIPLELKDLIERLAKNNHDIWAEQRMKEGWTYGPQRDDNKKEHPDLVPYEELAESEKVYDRNSAIETIKAILSLGFTLRRVGP